MLISCRGHDRREHRHHGGDLLGHVLVVRRQDVPGFAQACGPPLAALVGEPPVDVGTGPAVRVEVVDRQLGIVERAVQHLPAMVITLCGDRIDAAAEVEFGAAVDRFHGCLHHPGRAAGQTYATQRGQHELAVTQRDPGGGRQVPARNGRGQRDRGQPAGFAATRGHRPAGAQHPRADRRIPETAVDLLGEHSSSSDSAS